MVKPADQLQLTLRAHRYSLTNSRQIVFAALQDKEPQTMRELFLSCKDQIDRASLYRIIELFVRLGIVQRLQIGWKYKLELSNAFQEHHHHLMCIKCGKIIALPEDITLEARLMAMAARHHFRTLDHQLEIRGTCASCQ